MKIMNYITALFLLLTLIACQKTEEAQTCLTQEFDRQEMVSQLTTQYIIPAYNSYENSITELQSTVDIFLQSPTIDGLVASRNSWKKAALAWQEISFLEFGPAENIGLRSQTNIYPIDTNQISNNQSQNNYNLELPSNYSAKGLQAVDYLLHLPNQTDSLILQYYANHSANAIYLKEVIEDLKINAQQVTDNWAVESEDFINNTADNAQGSAISNIVNALSAHYETYVRKGKVGLPVGIFNGFSQTPMPEHAEAFYSGESLEMLKAQMKSIKNFINGKSFASHADGLGLDNYMDFVGAEKDGESLSSAINSQIESILLKIESINSESLSIAVLNEPDACKALYQSMQQLVPMLKVDLTSALGVLITYQDNDGD